MTTPATPSNQKTAADDRNLVAVDENTAVTFEEKLHVFWKKNGNAVLLLCGLVVVGILAKGGWDYVARQKEADTQQAYVAATTPEQLRAFTAAHPGHALAGIAQLRIADDAYTAGKSAEALAGYDQALKVVKDGPLAARAQLGRALAKIQAGKAGEGTGDLKQLVNDSNQLKAIRAESAYQLTSLAADAGNTADVQKFSDQLMQIDPSSPWTQRALALRASLPAPAAATAVPAAPAAKLKPGEKAPAVQLNLPAKK